MGMRKPVGNLYVIGGIIFYNSLSTSSPNIRDWHKMLGHPSIGVMEYMSKLKNKMTPDTVDALKGCE